MIANEIVGLVERLQRSADLWSEASGSSLSQLGRSAVNDSTFFSRLESPRGPTTATLEKFARFLLDPANWPDAKVPREVVAFGHVTGITPDPAPVSRGKGGELSLPPLAGAHAERGVVA